MPDDPQHIPVILLTGYLGSGKTTFLNALLRQPGQPRTLVLINEYGRIPVDNDLVVFSPDEAVVETMTGCLCCAIRGDLARTLRQAPHRFARGGKPWFERVVIETTGIADPAPVLATLLDDPAVALAYRLERTVVTVDAVNGASTLDHEVEALRQLAAADQVILTKADLAAAAALEALQSRILQVTAAPRFLARHGALPEAGWQRLLASLPDVRHQPVRWLGIDDSVRPSPLLQQPAAHGVAAVCLAFDEPVHGPALGRWLDGLLAFRGPDLLRVKGLVHLAETGLPMVIQGVQHVFHPPMLLPAWPGEDRQTRLVLIARHMDAAGLLDSLREVNRLQAASLAS